MTARRQRGDEEATWKARRTSSVADFVGRYLTAYRSGALAHVLGPLGPGDTYRPPGGRQPTRFPERAEDEQWSFAAFSHIGPVVEDQLLEGGTVARRITMPCTHTGTHQGVRPTNRRIAITYMGSAKIEDGKIAEEWAGLDVMAIPEQLEGRQETASP